MSESTDLIIRGPEILSADGYLERRDVAIANGKIQEVTSTITDQAAEAINGA